MQHDMDTHDWSKLDAIEADRALEDALLDARLDAARIWEVTDYFGGCPNCGQNNGYLNVNRIHIFICHTHKTAWCIGSNLFSDWRDETEETWMRNEALLEQYTEVEALDNPIFNGHQDGCPRCGARLWEHHHPVCQHKDGSLTAIPDYIVRVLLENGTPRSVLKALIAAEATAVRVPRETSTGTGIEGAS